MQAKHVLALPAMSSSATTPTAMPAMAPPEMPPPPPLLELGAPADVTVMPPFAVRTSWTLVTAYPARRGPEFKVKI